MRTTMPAATGSTWTVAGYAEDPDEEDPDEEDPYEQDVD